MLINNINTCMCGQIIIGNKRLLDANSIEMASVSCRFG